MAHKFVTHKENYFSNLKNDIPAGLVVFLVAIPLCLGIALASDAPLFSGILAGMIGGLVVPWLSQSQMSVTGPAAGLTVIVAGGIVGAGSFEIFLTALFLAGVLQVILGVIRAGFIAYYIPSAVIKGMLSAIGIILILKQLQHAIGYDKELFSLAFQGKEENTFMALGHAVSQTEWGALLISFISLLILIIWEKIPSLKKLTWLPGALVVVIFGIVMNTFLLNWFAPDIQLASSHLVALPDVNFGNFFSNLTFPDWSGVLHQETWMIALEIGIVASVETLLTIEAVDKIDPFKRKSPLNRELIAQGVGNASAGLIGAIPVTAVIVRSSAGIDAGGRTKSVAIVHGIFLLISVLFIAPFLNYIPLASLAAILLMVGYKLAKPSLFKVMRKKGWEQFAPFLITIVAILLTDLLIGVGIGIIIGLIFVMRTNFHAAFSLTQDGNHYLLRFNKDASFLNKPILMEKLEAINEGASLMVDGTKARFIDSDISEVLEEFEEEAKLKNISVSFKNTETYSII